MEYRLFGIKVSEETVGGYTLSLAECPIELQETVQEPLNPPFTSDEISERLTKLLILKSPQPIQPFPQSQREKELKEFGTILYNSLFVGQIGEAYRKCLELLREQDVGLLIRLHIEPAELRAIPWEYAYGDHLDGTAFLSLSPLTPIIRYTGKQDDRESHNLSSILSLAANPTRDKPDIDFGREKRASLRICREHKLEAKRCADSIPPHWP